MNVHAISAEWWLAGFTFLWVSWFLWTHRRDVWTWRGAVTGVVAVLMCLYGYAWGFGWAYSLATALLYVYLALGVLTHFHRRRHGRPVDAPRVRS